MASETNPTLATGPEQPAYIPGLSPAQENALAALVAGKTAVEAAEAAGVSRMTIYRWQHDNRAFMQAMNICRQQAHDAYARRMATLNEKALSVISMMLDKGDFRAAKLVVSFVKSQRDPDRESADAKDLFLFDSLVSTRKESPGKNAGG